MCEGVAAGIREADAPALSPPPSPPDHLSLRIDCLDRHVFGHASDLGHAVIALYKLKLDHGHVHDVWIPLQLGPSWLSSKLETGWETTKSQALLRVEHELSKLRENIEWGIVGDAHMGTFARSQISPLVRCAFDMVSSETMNGLKGMLRVKSISTHQKLRQRRGARHKLFGIRWCSSKCLSDGIAFLRYRTMPFDRSIFVSREAACQGWVVTEPLPTLTRGGPAIPCGGQLQWQARCRSTAFRRSCSSLS